MKIQICLAIMAIITAYMFFVLISLLGYGWDEAYVGTCKALGTDAIIGSEDIAFYDSTSSIVIISSGDLENTFNHGTAGPNRATPGSIWALDLASEPLLPKKMEIVGFPEGVAFQPHGIYVSHGNDDIVRLYVINHASQKGGTRIEIFTLPSRWSDQNLTLKYVRSLQSSYFPNQGINDVIEGERFGEIYVTQWLVESNPINGKHHPDDNMTFREKLYLKLGTLFSFFSANTYVYRCTFDTIDAKNPGTCSPVAGPYFTANGITINKERNVVYVNDAVAKKIDVLERDSKTGALTSVGNIELPYMADNIDFDIPTGSIMGGVIPVAYKAAAKIEGEDVVVPGSLMLITFDTKGEYNITFPVIHDGSELSMVSIGLVRNGRIILGSPFSNGVAICEVDETTG